MNGTEAQTRTRNDQWRVGQSRLSGVRLSSFRIVRMPRSKTSRVLARNTSTNRACGWRIHSGGKHVAYYERRQSNHQLFGHESAGGDASRIEIVTSCQPNKTHGKHWGAFVKPIASRWFTMLIVAPHVCFRLYTWSHVESSLLHASAKVCDQASSSGRFRSAGPHDASKWWYQPVRHSSVRASAAQTS